MFRHACRLGLEGIVSKRLGSRYMSGRTRDWLKFKTRTRRQWSEKTGVRSDGANGAPTTTVTVEPTKRP